MGQANPPQMEIVFDKDSPEQAVLDTLREDLAYTLARVEDLKRQLVFTALRFTEIPKDQWDQWDVSLGSPTVIRHKGSHDPMPKEVAEDE